MKYSERALQMTPSVTLAITAKISKLKEDGRDVIGFGAGEPDFNTPVNIINAAIQAMSDGKTKYTAASGITPLKQAIADKFKNDNDLTYDLSQISVSTGAKQCLANAFLALLNEGDEVLMAVPYWVTYPELVKLSGGVPVFCECSPANNYKLTAQLVEEYITPKSKVLILNTPNNPTGIVYDREELTELAEVAKKHNLLIIADEMYEKLIYGDSSHVSIAALSEDAYNRTLTINGVSKSYAMTGWRIGYVAGPKDIIKLMNSIQSHTTSNPCSIAQYASLEALTGDQTSLDNMIIEFGKRRDLMVDLIDQIPGLSCIKPEGAFYVMLNLEEVLGRSHKGSVLASGMDFADRLLTEKLVGVVPGEGFGIDGFVRMSYATSGENITKGMAKIAEFIAELDAE